MLLWLRPFPGRLRSVLCISIYTRGPSDHIRTHTRLDLFSVYLSALEIGFTVTALIAVQACRALLPPLSLSLQFKKQEKQPEEPSCWDPAPSETSGRGGGLTRARVRLPDTLPHGHTDPRAWECPSRGPLLTCSGHGCPLRPPSAWTSLHSSQPLAHSGRHPWGGRFRP